MAGSISEYGTFYVGRVLFGAAMSPLTNYYVGLTSGEETTSYMTGAEIDEITVGGYGRKAIPNNGANWSEQDYGRFVNTNELLWAAATADWGRITGWVICDSAGTNTGNVLWYGAMGNPRNIKTGDQYKIFAGGLKIEVRSGK